MTGRPKMGEPELRQRLIEFDEEVWLEYPTRTFHLVLVGGGALILLGHLSRVTDDLDALQYSSEFLELMEKYDISPRVSGAYADHFPYNWEDRIVPLEIETRVVRCYAASLEDIIASKLCSDRPGDEFDVRRPEVVRAIDWNLLAEVAAEMEMSQLNPRRHKNFLLNYESYREECRP